jgi:dTDP-4-amino-4,6-dideoxygalactose transaminase
MRNSLDTVEEFWSWDTIVEARECANDTSIDEFVRAFSDFIEVPKMAVRMAPSGTSALENLLRTRKDTRSVVMAPAFNCGRVQYAIECAGCKVKAYDFSPGPGRVDWDRVVDAITPDVGVIIITHYFGVPIDFREFYEFCRERDILLIEDCAHTLGGRIARYQVGTWGDAAIFSFNYDKPISLGWGGVALVNTPEKFTSKIDTINKFNIPDKAQEFELLREFVRVMQVRRSFIPFGKNKIASILRRICGERSQVLDSNCSISIGAIQSEIGIKCLNLYSEISAIRNANAEHFSSLCPLPTWPVGGPDVEPAWLKQKVFIRNRRKLAKISTALQKKGIRAGNFNWPNLIGGERWQSCPIASQVATCWMDVPVHQRMGVGEIEYVVSVIKKHAWEG